MLARRYPFGDDLAGVFVFQFIQTEGAALCDGERLFEQILGVETLKSFDRSEMALGVGENGSVGIAHVGMRLDAGQHVLKGLTGAQKMNVAALGNMVPQLHVHVIARFEGDAAWPKPVWGLGEARPYAPDKAGVLIEKLKKGLLG